MKIFGKKIGDLLITFLNGKPKTITIKDPVEMSKTTDMLKKAIDGDLEAQNEIQEILKSKDSTIIEDFNKKQEEVKQEIQNSAKEINSIKQSLVKVEILNNLETNDNFDIVNNSSGTKSYFLKGFKSELPGFLAERFASLLSESKDISFLINFWMLNLLNPNPEARRGLYKYITKQKLIVTTNGYLVTFRRVFLVKSRTELSTHLVDLKTIELFAEKIKSWKRGRKAYDVFQNKSTNEFLLKPIKNRDKNKLDKSLQFIGLFDDIYKSKDLPRTLDNFSEEQVITFTDAHTRKMIIRLNEPVRLDRKLCNHNAKIDCGTGLHVGTPPYVKNNSSLGDTILACLVNPMHVVSVPYSDAHKMRVTEYYPFKILTIQELIDFDSFDTILYEQQYKNIETNKLLESKEVSDLLTEEEKRKFAFIDGKFSTTEDLNNAIIHLESNKKELNDKSNLINTLFDDKISDEVNIEEIRKIVAARI